MVEEIRQGSFYDLSLEGWYLTTGRTLAHYNNAAQTRRSRKLKSKYAEDILLAPPEAEALFGERVILRTTYGETAPLPVVYSEKIRSKTLFCTFHHSSSRINAIFGDARDELIMTACFKSLKVTVMPVDGQVACS
jgi:formate dehydrogenase major subunit